MKKENIYKLLYIVGIFLIVGFVIRLGIDYFKYDNFNNSAPFYIYILIRSVEFIVPSIIIFIIRKVMQIKSLK